MLDHLHDKSLSREDALQLLHDTDCPVDFCEQFLAAFEAQNVSRQLRLLSVQRTRLLEQVHTGQKKLDRLDDLRYIIERQNRRK